MNRKYLSYIFFVVVPMGVSYFMYKHFILKQLTPEFNNNSSTTLSNIPQEKPVDSFSTTTRYYELSYEVPKDNRIVAQSIKDRAEKWLVDTNITKVTSDQQAEQDLGIFEGLKYAYDSKYKVVDANEYTSYVETVYEFTGGAHGATNNIAYIFSKKDGKQINSLRDIYNDSIYSALSVYSRKELPSQLAKKTIIVSEFQDMFDDGTEARQENWQTFYLKQNSLVIIFGQYQVGPYVIGIHELEVPLTVLEKYKK